MADKEDRVVLVVVRVRGADNDDGATNAGVRPTPRAALPHGGRIVVNAAHDNSDDVVVTVTTNNAVVTNLRPARPLGDRELL